MLRERLPEFMIPDRFIELSALPVTPTGKVHRAGLPDPIWERTESQTGGRAPSSSLEAKLQAIWCEVLGIKTLGVDEDFFSRGGDSLRAAQIVNRVASQLGIAVPVTALWDCPTVEDLALLLSKNLGLSHRPHAIATRMCHNLGNECSDVTDQSTSPGGQG